MNDSLENFAKPAPNDTVDWVMGLSQGEAERIRSARLKDEAGLRQYVLSLTGVYVLLSAASLMAAVTPMPPDQAKVVELTAIVLTAAAFVSIVTNYGARR